MLEQKRERYVTYHINLGLQSVDRRVREAARESLQLLTAREVDVLKLIVTAKSSRETATDLGISPRTVEVHRRRIMRKMQARNIADLVRIIASLD
jgi:FixJ family two-component response regulator